MRWKRPLDSIPALADNSDGPPHPHPNYSNAPSTHRHPSLTAYISPPQGSLSDAPFSTQALRRPLQTPGALETSNNRFRRLGSRPPSLFPSYHTTPNMAFAPPLPRLGAPLRLPKLLASLPNLGELSVVKPSNCRNPSRVFLITRSKIRYTARKPAPKAAVEAAAAAQKGAKVAATQVSKEATQWIEGGAMDDEGEIVARGKAWGLEFVDGECRVHSLDLVLHRREVQMEIMEGVVDTTRLIPRQTAHTQLTGQAARHAYTQRPQDELGGHRPVEPTARDAAGGQRVGECARRGDEEAGRVHARRAGSGTRRAPADQVEEPGDQAQD